MITNWMPSIWTPETHEREDDKSDQKLEGDEQEALTLQRHGDKRIGIVVSVLRRSPQLAPANT
jgi:hypothetical protein